MQSPAGGIVSAGSSSELGGVWCAGRPRISGAGAVSFSPVRASAPVGEVVPAVGLSLAGQAALGLCVVLNCHPSERGD